MREIKFRAWNIKHKYMDDTVFIRTCDGAVFDVPSVRFDTPNTEIEKSDDLIIMQYTGLKDANGVEIYEGDIVNIDGLAKEVKFEEFKDKSYGHGECYFTRVFGFSFSSRSGREPVVIGNIYQNPELLNG